MNESGKGELQKILKDITKNEIRISYHEKEELLSICSSKIGGKPAVPKNFKWPEFTAESYDGVIKSRPLSFMAQINLRDTVRYDTEGILPKEGILSFFYEQMSMLCGFAPEEKGCAQVYYQSPMEEECEAVTRGYCQGCPEDYAKIPQKEKEDLKKLDFDKVWMIMQCS